MSAARDRRDASSEKDETRKPYAAPRLEKLGDLRELTLGSSPGVTDSGGEGKSSLG